MASVNLHPEIFMSELFGVERTPDPTRTRQVIGARNPTRATQFD